MHDYQICVDNDVFGELYGFVDAEWIFFPHEFYKPIASSILGLMDRDQRQRVANPDHRGNYGYPPHYPSDRKLLVIDDLNIRPRRTEALLTDIAPSLLSLAGVTPPIYMKGVALFTENEPHQ